MNDEKTHVKFHMSANEIVEIYVDDMYIMSFIADEWQQIGDSTMLFTSRGKSVAIFSETHSKDGKLTE